MNVSRARFRPANLDIKKWTPTISNSVLLVIGVQKIYFEGPYKTRYMEHTSAAIAALVKRYRDAKGDIIHLHFEPSSHPEWWSGSDMAPHDTAAPKEGETVVMASMFNGFFGTNLKEAIDATGKGVVFVGYQMQVMVGSTIRSACDLGYELALASDCVGVRETGVMGVGADAVKRIELAILEDAYCIVLESRMITD